MKFLLNNGARPTNGGKIKTFETGRNFSDTEEDMKLGWVEHPTSPVVKYQAEIMGPGYTTHQTRMIAVYFVRQQIKYEVVYYINDSGHENITVLMYKGATALHYYYSRNYEIAKLPEKYRKSVIMARNAYEIVFKG